ncbi:MAG: hypothetical protein F6K39_36295 [Okeania sp. SIO3B3]|nr:hypothetical protein [Okeania sp. SIO3B3]
MGRPYSIIQKADEIAEAKKKFDEWQKKSMADKRELYQQKVKATGNLRTARSSVDLYLIPFGVDQTKNIWVLGSAPSSADAEANETDSEPALITKLTGIIVGDAKWGKTDAPTEAGSILVSSVKKGMLASVKIVEDKGKSDDAAAGVSRITGRPYTYTKKNSVSCRFGQKIGSEQSFEAAKTEIRKASSLSENQKLYFTNQKEIDVAVI